MEHFKNYMDRVRYVARTYKLPIGRAAVNTLAANYPDIHTRMFENELEYAANGMHLARFFGNVRYLMREYNDILDEAHRGS